ncbi:hypothetical protein H6P81_015446 [Aristolochia fimbriata]|uniref:Uncharacterized protein n=1 Tax=Aristolochia fimbriata TaxID=158543 RepID=A0AAV7E8H5_ARIFI|nr:hypothetical protein H6P81_015446 [Aristolochia fimbriata]
MIEQPSLSDDFTFPTVTAAINSPPHFRSPAFSSPSSSSTTPFWFVSASAAPESIAQPPDSKQGTHRRRSFTEGVGARVLVSTATSVTHDDDGEGSYVDEEERMDMLWEDLNDELGHNRGARKSSAGGSDPPSGSVPVSEVVARFYCSRFASPRTALFALSGSSYKPGRLRLLDFDGARWCK